MTQIGTLVIRLNYFKKYSAKKPDNVSRCGAAVSNSLWENGFLFLEQELSEETTRTDQFTKEGVYWKHK